MSALEDQQAAAAAKAEEALRRHAQSMIRIGK